jgi:predicted nucleic-acid-binding Zn-ribbon protein
MENEMISLSKGEFEEKITPKQLTPEDLFMFRCSSCGNVHFRHAGYIETMLPYIQVDKEKKVQHDSYCVYVCTVCKKCYIYVNSQVYDVTHLIDLNAWEKTEKEMHKMTGPGGNC